jgi:hypothetical protein
MRLPISLLGCSVMPGMPQRRFPPPWSVEETDACFIVRERAGRHADAGAELHSPDIGNGVRARTTAKWNARSRCLKGCSHIWKGNP